MFQQMRRNPSIQRNYQPNRYKNENYGSKAGKLERFSTSLDTVQQVLGVVSSTAPYIEKYGPIVQRIPMMYRMYRAMKAVDTPDQLEQKQVGLPKKNVSSTNKKQPNNAYPMPTLYI